MLIVDSIDIFDDNEVSRSDEVIIRLPSLISKRKLSKIGKVLFVFNMDPKICNFLNNSEEDIINFIKLKDIVIEENYKI